MIIYYSDLYSLRSGWFDRWYIVDHVTKRRHRVSREHRARFSTLVVRAGRLGAITPDTLEDVHDFAFALLRSATLGETAPDEPALTAKPIDDLLREALHYSVRVKAAINTP